MRQSPLLSTLTLGLFLLVPPVHAVNYTGEAWLDWSTLRFSGIPVTMTTDKLQQTTAFALSHNPNQESDGKNEVFPNWSDHTSTATIPSVTAVSIADASRLYASVNLTGMGSGEADVTRWGGFSATDTGKLTISIDYSLQQIGASSLKDFPLSSPQTPTVELLIRNEMFGQAFTPGERDSAGLPTVSGGGRLVDGDRTGILSVTSSFQRGESGYFVAGALLNAHSGVPVPDMLWPTLAGMIGIAFWAERRRRQARLAR